MAYSPKSQKTYNDKCKILRIKYTPKNISEYYRLEHYIQENNITKTEYIMQLIKSDLDSKHFEYLENNEWMNKERNKNMAYTEAQKKASIKYTNEKTDDIRLRVQKGLKEKYRNEATKREMSMTQFIINCVKKEIENAWLYNGHTSK